MVMLLDISFHVSVCQHFFIIFLQVFLRMSHVVDWACALYTSTVVSSTASYFLDLWLPSCYWFSLSLEERPHSALHLHYTNPQHLPEGCHLLILLLCSHFDHILKYTIDSPHPQTSLLYYDLVLYDSPLLIWPYHAILAYEGALVVCLSYANCLDVSPLCDTLFRMFQSFSGYQHPYISLVLLFVLAATETIAALDSCIACCLDLHKRTITICISVVLSVVLTFHNLTVILCWNHASHRCLIFTHRILPLDTAYSDLPQVAWTSIICYAVQHPEFLPISANPFFRPHCIH